ncbi:MAG: type IV secretory system conjugative DNA transfer family protein, partial [Lachnospiraceae bacterium]|nr:type IV secretory system conjugative DNA transfer family protein [Lachnospiraceae bacterium]
MASTKDLSHISPWLDLKKTFRGRGKLTAIFLAINLLLSGLIVGNAYEYFQYFMGRRRKIAVLNGIIIGIKECTLATFILMLVLFAFYYRFLRMLNSNKKDYENGVERSENATFGKAHFQDEDERKKNFKRYNSIADTSDEILGIDANGKYCCLKYPAGMNHNRLFCGAPGSGKTSAIIKTDIYQCIRRRQSIITTDSKGSLYAETSAVARANNYIVKVLNLKSDEIINSNAFNVMAPLNPNNTSFTAECQSIAEIIVNMTQAEDPMDYWAKQERQLLALA